MIYPVKVWTRKGLRKLLRYDKQKSKRALEALVLHQDNYKLSKTAKTKFKNIATDKVRPVKQDTYKYPEHAYKKGKTK